MFVSKKNLNHNEFINIITMTMSIINMTLHLAKEKIKHGNCDFFFNVSITNINFFYHTINRHTLRTRVCVGKSKQNTSLLVSSSYFFYYSLSLFFQFQSCLFGLFFCQIQMIVLHNRIRKNMILAKMLSLSLTLDDKLF